MKVLLKRIFKFIRPYILQEISGLILTILSSIAVFASPLVSKYLIDKVLPTNSMNKLYIGLILFFAVSVAQPVIGYFKDILFLLISEKISLNIKKNLFEKVITAPLKFFDSEKKGDIISRVVNSSNTASSFLCNFFISFIRDILLIVLILCGMFYTSVIITAIVIAFFIIAVPINIVLSRKFKELSLKTQKNFDNICSSISQSVDSIITVKSFSMEDHFRKKYDKVLDDTYKNNIRAGSLEYLLGNLSYISIVFSICIIYGIGTVLIMKGSMTIGSVIAMAMYYQLLIQPVTGIINSNVSIQKVIPVFDRIYDYMEMESEKLEKGHPKKLTGDIEIKNLNFSYNENIPVLKDINMQIKNKELVAVIGKSGSGKSTFVKLLMGFYKPEAGEIYIGGMNIDKAGLDTLRMNISYVPQMVDILNMSIKENIRIGRPDATDEEVMNICRKVKMHKMVMGLPEGYDSIINERANLSGGEIQRIGICRALIKEPSILILDEPTSSLDPENEVIVRELIEEISCERTVIVIAHRMSTIVNADKILVFEDGRLIESEESSYILKGNSFKNNYIMNHVRNE